MEVKEALIPSSAKNKFLLKLFNVHPPKGEREFREHKHIEIEIVLFKSGTGIYKTKDREYDIRPGDIFMFSGNEIHCITDISEDMHIMNIHFEPRFIWSEGNDLFDARYLQIFFNRSKNFENRLDRDNPHTKEIAKLLLKTEKEFYRKQPEFELMVKVYILTVLVTLRRHYGYIAEDDEMKSINFKAVSEAMDYINDHFSEELTLCEIAEHVNLSKNYLCSIFKKLNGVSVWDYLTSKRIEYAIGVIKKNKNMTMLEIATKCGFNNTANFNRAFKIYTGKTPKEI